jgi:hypothetical protein
LPSQPRGDAPATAPFSVGAFLTAEVGDGADCAGWRSGRNEGDGEVQVWADMMGSWNFDVLVSVVAQEAGENRIVFRVLVS